MKVQQTQSLSVLLGLVSYFASAEASSSTSMRNPHKHTRIINGTKAVDGRYNYFVALQHELIGHVCGGSLIAPDVVLAAAHCEHPDMLAVITRHDLDNRSDGTAIPIKGSLPHPNYDDFSFDNDFMLLFLRDPAPQDATFVKLNSNPNFPAAGEPVTVMGHGLTDPLGFEANEELLEVEVNVVSNEACEQSEGYLEIESAYLSYESLITDNMLCAADVGEDSCQGDSGGPLIVQGNDENGSTDILTGVVSWGFGCGDSDFPGVYARVSSAWTWIQNEVCNRSMYPPAEFDCDSLISSPTPTPQQTSSPTTSSQQTMTMTPTPTTLKSTSSPTTSSQPTLSPTVSCPPPYDSSYNYSVGDQVNFGEEIFICQPRDGSTQCTDDSSVWSHIKACCPTVFDNTRTDYQAYDKVSYESSMIFMCQPGPYEEYCNIHAIDWEWNDTQLDLYYNAWTYVGEC
uniref:Peptidase S1 domain-containing protein n=1 Tax=Skeletonema marinoi TaxID=267567 RepID=A0A7S1CS91_9STRA